MIAGQNRYTTLGIVLHRTNFGEADRILTFITVSHGKVRAIAKGVRRPKSKIAGGIELFGVNDLVILPGRSEINTLISARVNTHFSQIIKDQQRTAAAYDFLKIINKLTEHNAEPAYFELLKNALAALDDHTVGTELVMFWFRLRLLKLSGHEPNFYTHSSGKKLQANDLFNFNLETMCFGAAPKGQYNSEHVKFLRLATAVKEPQILCKVKDFEKLLTKLSPLAESMFKEQLRI